MKQALLFSLSFLLLLVGCEASGGTDEDSYKTKGKDVINNQYISKYPQQSHQQVYCKPIDIDIPVSQDTMTVQFC